MSKRDQSIAFLALMTGIALMLIVLQANAQSEKENSAIENGKSLFNDQCTDCHTIGGGESIGPDLKGVTQRRDEPWLIKFITNPKQMFAENDPTALKLLDKYAGVRMPNMGLSTKEAKDVLAYLKHQSK
jgi:protein SCO1/2